MTFSHLSPLTPKCGYALLFSVLIASVLLTVGMGISTIVYKELVLSSFGRESERAFYVADTAADCARYWYGQNLFLLPITVPDNFECAGTIASNPNFSITSSSLNDNYGTGNQYQFFLPVSGNGINGCADVVVKKYTDHTIIESNGRNVDCASLKSGANFTTNSRQVERGIRYRIGPGGALTSS